MQEEEEEEEVEVVAVVVIVQKKLSPESLPEHPDPYTHKAGGGSAGAISSS